MKQSLKPYFALVAIVGALTNSGCASESQEPLPVENVSSPISSIASQVELSETTTQSSLISDTDESNNHFLYKNVDFISVDGTGVMASYEEMQEILEIYAPKMNFVQYEIIEICSPEEKEKIRKEKTNSMLYKAKITYDYLNCTPVDIDFYLSKAGNDIIQPENQPPYLPGEKYAAFLMNLSYDSWNVALPEMTFAVKDDGLYQIKFDFMKFGDTAFEEIKQYEYTSTENNPILYVRKYNPDELSEYFRKDWESRGYSIKPLNDSIFDTDLFGYKYTDDGDVIPVD